MPDSLLGKIVLSIPALRRTVAPGASPNLIVELPSFDKGGLERVVLDTTAALRERGFTPTVVTPGRVGHLARFAEDAGIGVATLPEKYRLFAYAALIRRKKPIVAFSHFSDVGYRLFAQAGIPNVTVIHNVYAFLDDQQKQAMRRQARFVQRYVAVSRKVAAYAAQNIGLPAARISVIPNGLDTGEHEERERRPIRLTRADLGLAGNDYVFVHPASYNPHKGHHLIVSAMARIRKTRPDIKVICVGNTIDKTYERDLRLRIGDLGLEKHVLLPGYLPDIEDPMRIADACLMPSFIEGWSIAMLEAMFYAKPLLFTDTGGAGEVIEHDDIGLLLPTEYPDFLRLDQRQLGEMVLATRDYRLTEPLATAMLEFAENRAKWTEAGRRGRRKLYERYALARTVRGYETLINDLAPGSARPI